MVGPPGGFQLSAILGHHLDPAAGRINDGRAVNLIDLYSLRLRDVEVWRVEGQLRRHPLTEAHYHCIASKNTVTKKRLIYKAESDHILDFKKDENQ
ncbi:hypothetical protein TNCV_500781 [Trichonephila clavipes]|nr:hypothetical protein TNCV_500781 [Trichonephila clavipes]